MMNDVNAIPPELLKIEDRLKKNVEATRAFFDEHPNVFEQLQDLIGTRNELIEEGKSLCKRHECSTDIFKTNTAKAQVYDPQAFRDEFGPKKLIEACELKTSKVKAMVTAGLLERNRLEKVKMDEKVTVRVIPKVKPWVIPED